MGHYIELCKSCGAVISQCRCPSLDKAKRYGVCSQCKKQELISINEAAAKGIQRLRKPIWAGPMDHLKIDIVVGYAAGPWTHLYSPFNQECNGRDPVDILSVNMDYELKEYIPYDGPLPESEEYKRKEKAFEGVLKEQLEDNYVLPGQDRVEQERSFEKELKRLINRHSMENASNTPDFILAKYLLACLEAWNVATQQREQWYGRKTKAWQGIIGGEVV
jgi:hypothetical protein